MDVQNTAIYGDSAFAVTAPIHLVLLRCDRTGAVLDGTAGNALGHSNGNLQPRKHSPLTHLIYASP
jgi:hypothetical protein